MQTKLIDTYNHTVASMHGKIPLGDPDWIDAESYVDEDEVSKNWDDFEANDSIEIEEYSVVLNHITCDDPYHNDTLIVNIDVKQVFGEDEPFDSDEEREEYCAKYRYVGSHPGKTTVHETIKVSDLLTSQLQSLIDDLTGNGCES